MGRDGLERKQAGEKNTRFGAFGRVHSMIHIHMAGFIFAMFAARHVSGGRKVGFTIKTLQAK